jgi:hypothetical protein
MYVIVRYALILMTLAFHSLSSPSVTLSWSTIVFSKSEIKSSSTSTINRVSRIHESKYMYSG